MKVFVGGIPFLRALNSQDIPAQPLPYDDITISLIWEETIANEDTDVKDFTASDWGAGLDFYMSAFLIGFMAAAEPLSNDDDCIQAFLWDTISTPSEYFFRWSYTGKYYHFGYDVSVGWIFYRSYFLGKLRKILSTQTLRFSVLNASGQAITPSIFISGIPK